eukprot:3186723-Pleurochrysis_carterae.AAC.1
MYDHMRSPYAKRCTALAAVSSSYSVTQGLVVENISHAPFQALLGTRKRAADEQRTSVFGIRID